MIDCCGSQVLKYAPLSRYCLLVFLFSVFLPTVNAAPVITDYLPPNNSFFGRGNVNFYVNVTSSVSLSSATVFMISEDALINGEPWDSYAMSCAANNCTKTISFAIAGTDTLEFFYFEASDSNGVSYLGNVTVPLRFKIDRNPPIITFARPTNGSFVSSNVTVEVTATDAISGVNLSSLRLSLDNATWSNMTNSIGYFNSSPYSNNQTLTVYVKASDNLNNTGTAAINVTVDNEPPKISIVSHQNNATITGTVTFRINVTDVFSGVGSATVRLGSAEASMSCSVLCSAAFNTLQLPDNIYNLTFIAYDAAGNSNSSSILVTINNERPIIMLVPEGYTKGAVAVNASLTNPSNIISGVSLKIEKSGTVVRTVQMSCNSQSTFCSHVLDTVALGDGSYTMTANASNILNYTVIDTASLVVDNTKPSITITAPDFVKGLFTINAEIIDTNHDRTAVNYVIKSGGAMSCVAQDNRLLCNVQYDASSLSDGFYELNITATDHAKNTQTKSKMIGVDKTAPKFVYLKVEPIVSEKAIDVEFTAGLEDSISGVKSANVIIDHITFKVNQPLVKSSGLWVNKVRASSLGSHYISVSAEDNLGNSNTSGNVGYFFLGQFSCGDGVCQSFENYCLCSDDCSAPSCPTGQNVDCSSGLPTCMAPPRCGDEICSVNESCTTCGDDCGVCDYPKAGEIGEPEKNNPFVPENPLFPDKPGDQSRSGSALSDFIITNPIPFTIIGVALIAVSILIIKLRKPKPPPWKRKKEKSSPKEKPFIFGEK